MVSSLQEAWAPEVSEVFRVRDEESSVLGFRVWGLGFRV